MKQRKEIFNVRRFYNNILNEIVKDNYDNHLKNFVNEFIDEKDIL